MLAAQAAARDLPCSSFLAGWEMWRGGGDHHSGMREGKAPGTSGAEGWEGDGRLSWRGQSTVWEIRLKVWELDFLNKHTHVFVPFPWSRSEAQPGEWSL